MPFYDGNKFASALTPARRKRLYETGALILGGLVIWGVITAEEAQQVAEAFDKALGVALLVLARFNVNDE